MNYKEKSEQVRQEILEVLESREETDIIKITKANLSMMPLVHAQVLAYMLHMAEDSGRTVEEILQNCKNFDFLEVPVQFYNLGKHKATAPVGYGNYIKFDFESGKLGIYRDVLGIVPANNTTYLIDFNNRFGVFPETISKVYYALEDSGQNNLCAISHMWRRKSVTRKLINEIKEMFPYSVGIFGSLVETVEEFKCPEGASLLANSYFTGSNTGKQIHRHEFWYERDDDSFNIYVVNSRGFGKRYYGFDFKEPTLEELKSIVRLITFNTSSRAVFEI